MRKLLVVGHKKTESLPQGCKIQMPLNILGEYMAFVPIGVLMNTNMIKEGRTSGGSRLDRSNNEDRRMVEVPGLSYRNFGI